MNLIKLTSFDLINRLRSYYFVIIVIAILLLSYSISTGEFTFHYGDFVGVKNGSWLGLNFSIFQALFFSLIGFYLVKGNISNDKYNGVFDLFKCSMTQSSVYLLSKLLSNVIYLLLLHLIFSLFSLTALVIGTDWTALSLEQLILNQVLINLPLIILISCVAVFFDSHSKISGTIGNIIYFFMWITLINLSNKALSSYDLDILGFGIFKIEFIEFISSKINEVEGFWDLAFKHSKYNTMNWEGINWNFSKLLIRTVYILPGLCFYFLGLYLISKEDKIIQTKKLGIKLKRLHSFNKVLSKVRKFLTLGTVTNYLIQFKYLNSIIIESKFLNRNLSVYYFILIIWINLWTLFSANAYELRYTSFTWIIITPLFIWSKLGIYEMYFKTDSVLYSSSRSIYSHTFTQYISIVLITVGFSFGVILKAFYFEEYNLLIVLVSSLILLPALSFLFGVFTKSQKLFEVIFLLAWYMGPLRVHPYYDQLFQLPLAQIAKMSTTIFGLSALCLLMSMVSRNIQLKIN